MDLAKIRQKARQEQEKRQLEESQPLKHEIPGTIPVKESATWLSSVSDEDLLHDILPLTEPKPLPAVQPDHLPTPARHSELRDPLEVILAGREAAGCDEDMSLVAGAESESVVEEYQEYLCFRVSDEIYGINIMDIKEIIKPREVTEVPRAPSFVSGVLSLRGMIIPIIDMRLRLGLAQNEPTGKERIIVIKNVNSLSGLMVDEVIQVVQVQHNDVEPAPPVLDGIDRDFIRGIGRSEGLLMIILNLENVADIHLY